MSTSSLHRAAHDLAYRTVRENVSDLLTERPADIAVPVPACPGWTVGDVVAHLVGICRSIAGQPEEPTPAKGPADVGPLLAVWAEAAKSTERALCDGTWEGNPDIPVMDAFTHELDIRRGLGLAPPDGHPAHAIALDLVVRGFAASVRGLGLPAVRIEAPGAGWTAGQGEPAASWTAGQHDLLRSLTGRRSHAQIAAMAWSQDAAPWLPAFTWGPFTPPVTASE